jgi:signal transduction histidine kinase
VHAVVRSVWAEPRAPHPPARAWRDWALVGLLVPAAVLEGVLRPALPWRAVSVIVVAGLVPTLLWRRSRPLLAITIAFGTVAVAAVLTGGASAELQTAVYVLLLPYSLVRWGSGREVATGLTVMFGAVCVCMAATDTDLAGVFSGFAVLLSAIAVGAAFRYRARARLRELDQVKLVERERLARDLHDTVAHHVSAIAIRAQAGLATSASRPDAATEALRVIEAEASRTLAEMRAMVRVLRRSHRADEPAALAPGPCVADLEQLAGPARDSPPVDVEISGDLDDLPPSVGAAIYRLAQESVTNARRHARHATRIKVRVAADDTVVHLRVSDDGEIGLVRAAASPGYGLIGMIERAHLLGGTCKAGPDPDRGWTVTAVLPRAG